MELIYSEGLRAIMARRPNYGYRKGFLGPNGEIPVYYFFLMHPGDRSVGVEPHIESEFVVLENGESAEHLVETKYDDAYLKALI